MPIEGIFGAVSGAAVDDGGNVQNVAVDMVVLLRGLAFDGALSNPPDLVIASSSDPLEHFNTSWAEGAAGCVKYFKLGFEDLTPFRSLWQRITALGLWGLPQSRNARNKRW